MSRLLTSLGCAVLLAGTVFALSDGDFLLTKSYVDDTLVPQMEEKVDDHIETNLDDIYTEKMTSLEEVKEDVSAKLVPEEPAQVSAAIVPMDYGQGDVITLETGASLLVTDGWVQMEHNGTVVDTATGEVCASGSYSTTGHRYIVAENTTLKVTVISGIAKMGYAGEYGYTSGTGRNHPFYDVYRFDGYNDAVTFVYSNGLFNGVGEGKFAPAGSMTRAMVMTVLYRLAGEPADQLANSTVTFKDVPEGQWYSDPIRWGASQGVTQGMGEGIFDPDSGVTLVQMIQFLYNFGRNNLGMELGGQADLTAILGGDTVPDWGAEAAQWAVANGIWTATLDNRDAMRAEVSVMITNFAQRYGQNG